MYSIDLCMDENLTATFSMYFGKKLNDPMRKRTYWKLFHRFFSIKYSTASRTTLKK